MRFGDKTAQLRNWRAGKSCGDGYQRHLVSQCGLGRTFYAAAVEYVDAAVIVHLVYVEM